MKKITSWIVKEDIYYNSLKAVARRFDLIRVLYAYYVYTECR
jgi:hypothetical protein